jgi:hypothetical protein
VLLASGRLGVFLLAALLAVIVCLIVVLALVGTFGESDTREAAQAVTM